MCISENHTTEIRRSQGPGVFSYLSKQCKYSSKNCINFTLWGLHVIAKKGSNKFLISAVFEIDTKKIILLFELCNLVQLSTNNLS